MQIFSSFFASIKNLLDPIDENNTIQLPGRFHERNLTWN